MCRCSHQRQAPAAVRKQIEDAGKSQDLCSHDFTETNVLSMGCLFSNPKGAWTRSMRYRRQRNAMEESPTQLRVALEELLLPLEQGAD